MVVLDTDLLIGLLRSNEEAAAKINEIEQQNIDIFTTTITSYELFKGAYLSSDSSKNLLQISKLLQNIKILDFDLGASDVSAKINSHLKKRGAFTSVMDQMIAAITISNGKTLVTRNIKHYKNIPNLRLEKW